VCVCVCVLVCVCMYVWVCVFNTSMLGKAFAKYMTSQREGPLQSEGLRSCYVHYTAVGKANRGSLAHQYCVRSMFLTTHIH